MNEFDSRRFRVANPEALGQKEKELWKQLEPIINEILDELKKGGKIETRFLQTDLNLLDPTLHKLDDFSSAHNVLIDLFSVSDSRGFLESTAKFGFTERTTVSTYIMSALMVSMLSTELFKLFLLFVTKDIDKSVANFSRTMAKHAPRAWEKLEPFVDADFRNAIAHGTYAIVDRKIKLFKNAKLETDNDGGRGMELGDFMMRIKDQNVLYQVLVNVIVDKSQSGFFFV